MFWDLFGEQGHPVRATISEVGPLLLSRLMDLNEVQEGVLNICFRIADEQGLLILDLKDLRAMLGYLADHAAELTVQYGNVSKPTIGTIQRQLLVLENQGGAKFFSEPALALKDFIRTDRDGRGFINILAADKLMENPRLYATFLLWLLSELFEELPEVGDLAKPKLCFFFDEVTDHGIFDGATIDGGIGADLNVVANDNGAELRNLDPGAGRFPGRSRSHPHRSPPLNAPGNVGRSVPDRR